MENYWKPDIKPVGLPCANWQWNTSCGFNKFVSMCGCGTFFSIIWCAMGSWDAVVDRMLALFVVVELLWLLLSNGVGVGDFFVKNGIFEECDRWFRVWCRCVFSWFYFFTILHVTKAIRSLNKIQLKRSVKRWRHNRNQLEHNNDWMTKKIFGFFFVSLSLFRVNKFFDENIRYNWANALLERYHSAHSLKFINN